MTKRPSKKGDKFTCWGFEGVYTCKGFLREGSNVLHQDMPDIDHSGIKVQSEETELAYRLLDCTLVEEQTEEEQPMQDAVTPKRPSKKGDRFKNENFVYIVDHFEDSNHNMYDTVPEVDGWIGVVTKINDYLLFVSLSDCELIEEQSVTEEHQYKVGDKVVPHSKSVGVPLDLCSMWINEGGKEQGYLYVVGDGSFGKEGVMVTTLMLSIQSDSTWEWNHYLPSDVTPYTEPKPVVEDVEPNDKPSFFCDSSRCWAESGTEKYCKFFQPCSENADMCIHSVDSSSGKEKICVSTDAKDDYDKFKAKYENISPMKNTEDTQAELQQHEEQTPTSEPQSVPTKCKWNYYDPTLPNTCACSYTEEVNCKFFEGETKLNIRCRFCNDGCCTSIEAIKDYNDNSQDHNVTISALQFEIRTLTKQLQEKEAALERRAIAYNDELCRKQDEIERLGKENEELNSCIADANKEKDTLERLVKDYSICIDEYNLEMERQRLRIKHLEDNSYEEHSALESELAEYKGTVNVLLRKLSQK